MKKYLLLLCLVGCSGEVPTKNLDKNPAPSPEPLQVIKVPTNQEIDLNGKKFDELAEICGAYIKAGKITEGRRALEQAESLFAEMKKGLGSVTATLTAKKQVISAVEQQLANAKTESKKIKEEIEPLNFESKSDDEIKDKKISPKLWKMILENEELKKEITKDIVGDEAQEYVTDVCTTILKMVNFLDLLAKISKEDIEKFFPFVVNYYFRYANDVDAMKQDMKLGSRFFELMKTEAEKNKDGKAQKIYEAIIKINAHQESKNYVDFLIYIGEIKYQRDNLNSKLNDRVNENSSEYFLQAITYFLNLLSAKDRIIALKTGRDIYNYEAINELLKLCDGLLKLDKVNKYVEQQKGSLESKKTIIDADIEKFETKKANLTVENNELNIKLNELEKDVAEAEKNLAVLRRGLAK